MNGFNVDRDLFGLQHVSMIKNLCKERHNMSTKDVSFFSCNRKLTLHLSFEVPFSKMVSVLSIALRGHFVVVARRANQEHCASGYAASRCN